MELMFVNDRRNSRSESFAHQKFQQRIANLHETCSEPLGDPEMHRLSHADGAHVRQGINTRRQRDVDRC